MPMPTPVPVPVPMTPVPPPREVGTKKLVKCPGLASITSVYLAEQEARGERKRQVPTTQTNEHEANLRISSGVP